MATVSSATLPEQAGSKFAADKTEAGYSVPGGEAGVIGVAYGNLLSERQREAEAFRPELVEVKLKYVALAATGYELRDRKSLSGVPCYLNRRPTRIWNGGLGGAALLDSFFEGGDAWDKLPDARVFDSLLETCQLHRPRARVLRRLNDLVAVACALRAGLRVGFDQLPHPA